MRAIRTGTPPSARAADRSTGGCGRVVTIMPYARGVKRERTMNGKTAACAAALVLAGCQSWGPTWSELQGVRYDDITSMTEMPVVVNLVDGYSPGTAPREVIKVSPGQHKLVLQAVPPAGATG